ncbi:HNH endonuclease signature motif containing protein, partial [Herbiconiux sp. YIM B11900]|uniref:HNH endonuclease signature motif containing protein n=1 Tax=Herbiconiux sp. YIM B11900 TaxID=3404131 RepID=UPI003F86000A
AGRGIRPQVILTVPALSLLGHTEQPAELHGYGPIDPVTARRLTAQAPSVTRWLTDPVTGHTLSVGRESYRIPADLRLALTIEDETCRFPGCRRRAQRCELDHVHAWAEGGETSHGNLASLCPKHHHFKHESDWTVEALPGRDLRWTSPIGRVHVTEPANPAHPPWPESPSRPESPPADLESPPPSPTFHPVDEQPTLPAEALDWSNA